MDDQTFWKVWHSFFPARLEPFLRFKWMAAFVVAIGVVDLVFKLVIKLPPDMLIQIQRQESLVRAPAFLICYNVIMVLGFWIIYQTRRKPRYYAVRVVAFGVVLAGLLGQMLILFVPWHI